MATPAVPTAGVDAATSGLRRRTALATLSIQALTGASLDRLMTQALETAVMLTGGAEASLWQLTPSAGRLERRQAVRGLSPGRGLGCSAGTTTAFGCCLITGQPVLVGDWRRDGRFERPPHPEGTGMRSTAVVPVPGGAWTGVLAVHAGGAGAFSADTTVMLSDVAGVLGAGIRRSALERLLRARSGQLAALAELGRLALSDTPLGQVLQRATRLLADAMGADLVTVCIRDADGAVQVDAAHPTGAPAEHSLRPSLTVGIGPERRHGTLSLHSRRADAYSWSDGQLVEACATLLAAAVERCPAAGLERAGRRAVPAMLQADVREPARTAGEPHDDTVQETAAILFTLDRVVKAAGRGDGAAVLATAV
jgi:GAF domain-containing protein